MQFYYAFLVLMICQLQKCPLLLNNSLHVIKIVFFAGQFNHKMLFSSDLFIVFSLKSIKDLFQDLFGVRLVTSELYPRLASPFYYKLEHQLVGQKIVNNFDKANTYFLGENKHIKIHFFFSFSFLWNGLFCRFSFFMLILIFLFLTLQHMLITYLVCFQFTYSIPHKIITHHDNANNLNHFIFFL